MICQGSKFILISIVTFLVGIGSVQTWRGFSVSKLSSINAVPPIEIQTLENPENKCFDFDEVKSVGFVNSRNINRIYSPYPKEALKQKIQGNVIIEVLVDEKGTVQCVRNILGHPILVESVKSSSYSLYFSAYLQDGKNIRYRGFYGETFTYNP